MYVSFSFYDPRLLDLQSRLNETLHSKEQVEKNIFTLTEELRSLRNKVENQQAQFSTVVADLRLRSRRLEEENKLQVKKKQCTIILQVKRITLLSNSRTRALSLCQCEVL